MLGIFLLPLSASIRFDNKQELILQKINLTSSAQEKPRYWLVYSVPVVGLQIEGFDDAQSCTDKQNEEKGKGNTIGQECKLGVKPVYNLGGQQITETDLDFGCSANPLTYHRCFIKVIYKLVWEPLAGLARLAAEFLDFFIYYSTNSEAYKNGFINSAWATVRDVANLFFILGLLYVAIKTILGLNVSDNKKIIGGIIIIALVINFSLFATRIVIDSGNVLAKIFYNQITPQDSNGNPIDPGDGRNKSVTVGIVSIINPQSILGQENITKNFGQFVIVLFITLAMIIYLIFMFFSLSMMFVARIASLWIAMIFSPIAFITYALNINIPSLGFKEWSKNLIGNAFMAPIFIFFLYIILLLGRSLQSITYSAEVGKDAILSRTMSSVVPLLIIFVLLREAKKMTVKYAGEMGEAFSKAPMIAGLALGATAAGSAMIARKTIGSTIARASRGQTLSQRAANNDPTLTGFRKVLGSAGAAMSFNKFFGKDRGYTGKKGERLGVTSGIGGLLNRSQRTVGEVDHARHEMDEAKKKAGVGDIPDDKLSFLEEQKVKLAFAKDHKTEYETMVRNGQKELKDQFGVVYSGGENGFYAAKRQDIIDKVKINHPTEVDNNGDLTDQGKERVKDMLKVEFNAALKLSTEKLSDHEFGHIRDESRESVNPLSRIASKAGSGSYDIRNINPKSDKREGLGVKATVGIVAAVALGMRTGLKSANANPGTGKSDFVTDIGNIITSALKGVKINVPSGGGHDDHAKDDHGGGGGGGHH